MAFDPGFELVASRASTLSGTDRWRGFAVGFGAVPALIILLLRGKYMWESPLWTAHHAGLTEAARLLEKTYDVKVRVEESVASAVEAVSTSYTAIFSQPYLARTVLVSVVSITQSLEYFAVGFYLPSISSVIFGHDFVYAAIGTLVSTVAGVIGGLIAAAYVDKVGIRRLIITGYTIVTVSLLLFVPMYGVALNAIIRIMTRRGQAFPTAGAGA